MGRYIIHAIPSPESLFDRQVQNSPNHNQINNIHLPINYPHPANLKQIQKNPTTNQNFLFKTKEQKTTPPVRASFLKPTTKTPLNNQNKINTLQTPQNTKPTNPETLRKPRQTSPPITIVNGRLYTKSTGEGGTTPKSASKYPRPSESL